MGPCQSGDAAKMTTPLTFQARGLPLSLDGPAGEGGQFSSLTKRYDESPLSFTLTVIILAINDIEFFFPKTLVCCCFNIQNMHSARLSMLW